MVDSVVVTVISHEQAIVNLQTNLEGLKAAGVLNNGQVNSLSKKLDNALRNLDKNKPDKAIEQLTNFTTQVNELIADGVLTNEEGQPLIASAERISAAIAAVP